MTRPLRRPLRPWQSGRVPTTIITTTIIIA